MAIVTYCSTCEKDIDAKLKGHKSRLSYAQTYGEQLDITCPTCKNQWTAHIDDVRMVQGQALFFWVPVALAIGILAKIGFRVDDWIISISPGLVTGGIVYYIDKTERDKAEDFNKELVDPERKKRQEEEQIKAYWEKRKNK